VPALQLERDVLEKPDPVGALVVALSVARELDEVERMVDRQGAREVADERDARFQGADQKRIEAGVLARQLAAELADTRRDLVGVEEDLPDTVVESFQEAQDAFRNPYRAARRSKSRS